MKDRFAFARRPLPLFATVGQRVESGRVGDAHKGNLPLALESDREAIETALFSALPGATPRLCRIRDTRTVDTLAISEALLPEAAERGLAVVAPPAPLPFDLQGNLF